MKSEVSSSASGSEWLTDLGGEVLADGVKDDALDEAHVPIEAADELYGASG